MAASSSRSFSDFHDYKAVSEDLVIWIRPTEDPLPQSTETLWETHPRPSESTLQEYYFRHYKRERKTDVITNHTFSETNNIRKNKN